MVKNRNHSVQNLVLSPPVKDVPSKVYTAVYVSIVVCGCETWSVIPKPELGLRCLITG